MALSPKIFKKMTKLITGSMSAGHYDVRLAQSVEEIHAAQNLRYEVLFKESGVTTKPLIWHQNILYFGLANASSCLLFCQSRSKLQISIPKTNFSL